MKRIYRVCIVFIAAMAALLPGTTAWAQSSDYSGSLYIEEWGMNLDFTISGGTILTAQGVEDHTDCQLTGAVRPGETITVSGAGKAMPEDDNPYTEVLDTTLFARIDCSPRMNSKPHDASEETTIKPGGSGSVSASLVVPEGTDSVMIWVNMTSPWRTNYGSGSAAILRAVAVFEVEEPESTPIPAAPIPAGPTETLDSPAPSPSPSSPVVTPSPPGAAPDASAIPADDTPPDVPADTPVVDTTAGWAATAAVLSLVSALVAALPCAAAGGTGAATAGTIAGSVPPAATESMAGKAGKALEKATEKVVSGLGTLDSVFKVLGVENRLKSLIDAYDNRAWMHRQLWRWHDITGDEKLRISAIRSCLANVRMGNKLSDAIDAYNDTMSYIGIGMDAWENAKSADGEGGVLIAGDGWLKAVGKSVAVNYIMDAILEKNPNVAVMEAATTLLAGGTEAGDIISPVTTMKGAFNMLIDTAHSAWEGSDTALARANAGVYGPNIQNLSYCMELTGDAVYDSKTFLDEFSNVVSDKDWYENMYDTAGKMWRDEHGKLTMVGKVAEPVTQMGVAITETVAGMARAAGTVTEFGLQKLKNFFAW